MVQGQVILGGRGGLALFLYSFFKVYHFYIDKLFYKVIISCCMQPTSTSTVNISWHLQSTSGACCSWRWLCYMLKCMCGQVLVLPSECLVCSAADDAFVKLLYSLQNCVMHLMKNYFFCHHNFMEKSHAKLSKNEPKNIP